MSFVTKDGFWIEEENDHEFIVPRKHRSALNVLDDWSQMSKEELQIAVSEALKKRQYDLTIVYWQGNEFDNTNLME